MAECDLLAANIGSCSDTTSKGFATIGYVGNHSQATPTLNLSTGLVTELTSTGKIYEVYQKGNNPFSDLTFSATERKTGMVFGKEIKVFVKGITPASALSVKALAGASVFMILKQLGEHGNAKYPILGIESPMRCTGVAWSAEEGAFEVTLAENNADMPALFLWKTNESTTDALIAGLLPS